MINNQKVGVGIVTCNRPDSFKTLLAAVSQNTDVDEVAVVKNKDYSYGEIQFENMHFFHVMHDVGVGKCKNIALSSLMKAGCQHIFLIEDDVEIVDNSVFRRHVETAQHFKLGHLNWNTVQEIKSNTTYTIVDRGFSLDISTRLCGCFSYFSREALEQCGLMDAAHYINALEHVEHLYRIATQGFTTPYLAFSGIHDSDKMLKNVGEGCSTIDHSSDLYKRRLNNAYQHFEQTYGRRLNEFRVPSRNDVLLFLSALATSHNGILA